MKYRHSILLAALILGGCGDKKNAAKPTVDASEILPGSASDAMLGYDGLKSQPPLAGKDSLTDKGDNAGNSAGDAANSGDSPEAKRPTNAKPDQTPAAGVDGPSIDLGGDAKPGGGQ